MTASATFYRHSRESGNPFLSQSFKSSMDSRFRGNDDDESLVFSA